MICILLASLGLFLIIYGIRSYKDTEILGIVLFTFFGFIGSIVIVSGVMTYPLALARIEKIKTLEIHIDDIKNSRYDNIKSSNLIIQGDIENMKQSTALSDYKRMVYEAKAKFNKGLLFNKLCEQSYIMWFFGDGFFIDSRIQDINSL